MPRAVIASLHSLARGVYQACAIIGLTLAGLITVELGLWLAFALKDRITAAAEFEVADAFGGAPWAADYHEEDRASYVMDWHPYVYWRRKPYRGEHINVMPDGIRWTPMPEAATADAAARRPKVLVFGGSTAWGTGARDAATIPALIGVELFDAGVPVEIVNMGEAGYVSTQELVSLILEIRDGDVPDLVIFYDGLNDTFSAYQQGVAGNTENEFYRVHAFDLLSGDRSDRLLKTIVEAGRSLATYRFLQGLMEGMNLLPQFSPPKGEDAAKLAEQVVTLYLRNVEMATELGKGYGFGVLSYWQPRILDKPNLTRFEASMREKMTEDEGVFHEQAYQAMRERLAAGEPDAAVTDISTIFEDVAEPLFVDEYSHVGERGNQIVAQRIARDALAVLRGRDEMRAAGAD